MKDVIMERNGTEGLEEVVGEIKAEDIILPESIIFSRRDYARLGLLSSLYGFSGGVCLYHGISSPEHNWPIYVGVLACALIPGLTFTTPVTKNALPTAIAGTALGVTTALVLNSL